ncbi:helix-turn-helix transcriptional regulator [Roseibium denhamense]|uniref:Phage repressor protein C, contains Cro/C1-type HTH and peptisase s24 domains n=1 Tax=Roseibium denhamense TaxID=76305 RepID=A0ABY1P4J6_9HYPH|nr:helix-turn-helix transcriptional regulator [Roseibium denhamense]MTI07256.1 helix-turn-helix transcriptional regulator [Roseibium denhamense]SMP26234.1 Phage repressor protein C, contains Cro/C1-type HTH and peptisase s24 domains [Roseibium denhamense]
MLSHEKVWAAIDALASQNGLTPSGLARRAGLDPTTFNRSKRVAADGRPRWPSTESLAKILDATGEGLKSFAARIERSGAAGPAQTAMELPGVPMAGFKDVGEQAFDTSGRPTGASWTRLTSFLAPSKCEFALQVSGDEMLPLYRKGDIIIADPSIATRKGDRVVVKTSKSDLSVYTLSQRTPQGMVFRTIGDNPQSLTVAHSAIEWTARIIWASQ